MCALLQAHTTTKSGYFQQSIAAILHQEKAVWLYFERIYEDRDQVCFLSPSLLLHMGKSNQYMDPMGSKHAVR
jgi:hypothetical protein